MNETTATAAGESLNALAGGQAVITTHQLRQKGACESNVEQFRSLFGASAVVTEENALKAIGMDFGWAAEVLLPPYPAKFGDTMDTWYTTWCEKYQAHYQPEIDAYAALRQERRDKCDETKTSAEYDRVYESYDKRLEELREAKDKSRNEAQAIWFARLYRFAAGITTDEWMTKEKDDASQATGSTDGNADTVSDAPTTAAPSEASPLAGGSGPEDSDSYGGTDGANGNVPDAGTAAAGDEVEGDRSGEEV